MAYNSTLCCAAGNNNYVSPSNGGIGCCEYDSSSPNTTNCCAPVVNSTVSYLSDLNICTSVPNLSPCPCEGCCDFNCCDEVDYFMHKAFFEYYHDSYANFTAFYDDFYGEFY